MGGDETGYGHQNVALGAFEDGFEVLGLGALPAVARGKDGTGEFRRVDTAVGDPLAYGGADDEPDRAHTVDVVIELLGSAGDAERHGFALEVAALADGRLHAGAFLIGGQEAMKTPRPLLRASLVRPRSERAP